MVAAFEDISAIQRAASFTAVNVYRPGDTVCVPLHPGPLSNHSIICVSHR